jgi:hypothetical protein
MESDIAGHGLGEALIAEGRLAGLGLGLLLFLVLPAFRRPRRRAPPAGSSHAPERIPAGIMAQAAAASYQAASCGAAISGLRLLAGRQQAQCHRRLVPDSPRKWRTIWPAWTPSSSRRRSGLWPRGATSVSQSPWRHKAPARSSAGAHVSGPKALEAMGPAVVGGGRWSPDRIAQRRAAISAE